MAKHLVKCKICGKELDLNSEQGVKCGPRRYAHFNCFPEGEIVPMEVKESSWEQKIIEYCQKIMGENINIPIIKKQIKKYVKENGYTEKSILRTLEYWYGVMHSDPSKANGGIGIVPYVFESAKLYYYELHLAEQANANINAVSANKTKEVTIKTPFMQIKKKIFKFLEEE